MLQTIDLLAEDRHPLKAIWFLAWPTLIEQLLLTCVQYADTAMVGAVGPASTAAIAVSASTTWLINGLFTGLATGFAVLVGRAIGAAELERARRIAVQALLAAVCGGGLLSLLVMFIARYLPGWMGAEPAIRADATAYLTIIAAGYVFNCTLVVCSNLLRCAGDSRTPMFFNLLTNIINVILNFFLIFRPRDRVLFGRTVHLWGAGQGVSGAAAASVIAVAFSAVMLVIRLWRGGTALRLRGTGRPRHEGAVWSSAFHYGLPVTLERITISGGQIVLTALVTGLGTTALAAHQYAVTAEAMVYLPMFGFSSAATTLVAQSLGARNPRLARRFGDWCLGGGVVMMTVLGGLLFAFAPQLVGLFTRSREVAALGGSVLRVQACAEPLFAASTIIFGALRGSRDNRFAAIAGVVGMWLVRLPLAWILLRTTRLGLYCVWIAMASDMVARAAIAMIRYRQYRWLNG